MLNRKEEIISADLFALKLLQPNLTKQISSSCCLDSIEHSMLM